jgi:hypothetical protein
MTIRFTAHPPVAVYNVVAIVHDNPDKIAAPIPPSSHFLPADDAE